jgi:hypothetical protein
LELFIKSRHPNQTMTTTTENTAQLAALWVALTIANQNLAAAVRRCARSGTPANFDAMTEAKKPARAAYRAFWDAPGATEYARNQLTLKA